MKRHAVFVSVAIAGFALLTGCVTKPPTIAHVHIGHALTGVHVTPNHKGYLLVAEQRAAQVFDLVMKAQGDQDLPALREHVAAAVRSTDSDDDFGLKQSLIMASNHITFAATSEDASANVQKFAPTFAAAITPVVRRCDTIKLLGKDISTGKSLQEDRVILGEMAKLADANVHGDDSDGNGVRGSSPGEYGMEQLRGQLEGMIARENPPYRTVDEWYLFNLVRLPNGRWVFDKLSRGGNIDGYK